jgi:glyoxylase-like metal-dependent hydrolase (beta-lactamase superfamily II)
MRMHLLSGGRLRMRARGYYPAAERGTTFELPVSCALFKHTQGAALFDTGCHPDAAVDGEARWGATHAGYSVPIFRPEEAVVGQLALAGLRAADIDLVICSHLHYDHCGCNAFFPRATLICHARELDTARAPGAEPLGFLAAEWDLGGTIQAIDAAHDVFGDGRLTLLPVPGHTPGMIAAHAVLDRDGAFLLASDAIPVQACLTERYAPRNSWDAKQFVAALDEMARLQGDGAQILFGHDDAQWRTLRQGAAFYA